MTEQRRIYRVSQMRDAGELNRILGEMAERLDQLEGYRGQGRFLTNPTSDNDAAGARELVTKSQAGLDAAIRSTVTASAAVPASKTITDLSGQYLYAGGLMLSSPVWDDQVVPLSAFRRGGGTKEPAWTACPTGSTVYALEFDDAVIANQKEVFFALQLPHRYKVGSGWEIHVHWCPSTAAVGNVYWSLEYSLASLGRVFPASSTVNVASPSGGVPFQHNTSQVKTFGGLDVNNLTTGVSAIINCRLARRSAHALDTYSGSALVVGVDAHFQVDTLGSAEEYTK